MSFWVIVGLIGCNLIVFGLGTLTGARLLLGGLKTEGEVMDTVDLLSDARKLIIEAQRRQEWGGGLNWRNGLLDSLDAVIQREHDTRIRISPLEDQMTDFDKLMIYHSWPNWGEDW